MGVLKKIGPTIGVFLTVVLLTFAGWQLFGPKLATMTANKDQTTKPTAVRLTAVGDSLTYGVGDATKNGGYVGLIQSDMENTGNYTVTSHNYGVSGDTSTQILKRIRNQKAIQTNLKQADIITVTVGGNDLMHVLQSNFLELSEQDVTQGITKFQNNLTTLLKTIRSHNEKAPIYLFGIYNPFYVYFPKLTNMTDSVTKWNQATQNTIKSFDRVHYVDIDQVLSTGETADQKQSTKDQLASAVEGKSDDGNPLIFTQDHFHPNNAGYEQMTKQLWTVMQKSKKEWE